MHTMLHRYTYTYIHIHIHTDNNVNVPAIPQNIVNEPIIPSPGPSNVSGYGRVYKKPDRLGY